MDGSAIVIEVMHSTIAACEPDSLDRTLLRDLAGAGTFQRPSCVVDLQRYLPESGQYGGFALITPRREL